MLVPSALVGDYPTVKKKLDHAVSQFTQNAGWTDALNDKGLMDTRHAAGLILLNGPSPLLNHDPHIHAYLPLSLLTNAFAGGRLSRNREIEIFRESLTADAGVLGLLAPANIVWVYDPKRHKPFLEAVCRSWSTFEAEGNRFSVGSASGSMLWSISSNLKFVLARRGLEASVLNGPLPRGGIFRLVSGLEFP
jgi:hypothetical protein